MQSKSILDSAEFKAAQQYRNSGVVSTTAASNSESHSTTLSSQENNHAVGVKLTETKLPKVDLVEIKVPTFNASTGKNVLLAQNYSTHYANPSPETTNALRVKDFFPDAPVDDHAMVPLEYWFENLHGYGILRKEQIKNNTVLTPELDRMIVITTIYEGEYGQNDEKVELLFHEPAKGQFKSAIIDRETLAKESTITILNRWGYAITHVKGSSEAKKLMDYLKRYEQVNYLNIKRQAMSPKIGFKDTMDDFALYSPSITIIPEGKDEKRLLEQAYIMKGTDLDEYIATVKKVISDNSVATFAYALSFASVLLKVLDAPSFSVELCRNSGFGKTVLQKLALGVWGVPKKLLRGWKSTMQGIETLLDFSDGAIVCLEDAHMNQDIDFITDIFYMVFNETGKMRGAKHGGNRRTAEFKGILFSSTETESSKRINYDGINRRRIEILLAPFKTKQDAIQAGAMIDELHEDIYGLAGKQWIKFLQANKQMWSSWKSVYKQVIKSMDAEVQMMGLSDTDITTAIDQNRLLASVVITMQLMNCCFSFNIKVDDVIREIRGAVYGRVREMSKPVSALQEIVNWAITNEQSLFKYGGFQQHGVISPSEHIAIFPKSVEYFLKKENFNASVVDQWKAMGILEMEADGKTNPKVKVNHSKRHRMYKFKWSALVEHCGDGFYDYDKEGTQNF